MYSSWYHASNEAPLNLHPVIQKPYRSMKPVGVWFARDDTWITWNQDVGVSYYKYKYQLQSKSLKLLTIDPHFKRYEDQVGLVNWAAFTDKFDGLYIPRYTSFDKRGPFITYIVDVDSIVIWNVEKIQLSQPNVLLLLKTENHEDTAR